MSDNRCVCCGEIIPEGMIACPNCLVVSKNPNCGKCRYRLWLARLCDIHVWGEDCDKYGTDLCKKMNDPQFIKWMDERNEKYG